MATPGPKTAHPLSCMPRTTLSSPVQVQRWVSNGYSVVLLVDSAQPGLTR